MNPDKSTNVREMAARWSVQVLDRVAPALAARAVARLFLRTPGRSRPAGPPIAGAHRFAVRFGRGELALWTVGHGPAVLLVHGWGGQASQLRVLAGRLVAAGYRAVALDAPGHGASTGTSLSLPQFAAAIERAAEGAGGIHALIAHSFGAAAGALALGRGLRAACAVLIGPPADEERWFEQAAARLRLSARVKAAAHTRIESIVGVSFDGLKVRVVGPKVLVPTLILHDRGDREVPFADGEEYARHAPCATLVATDGLGHRRILSDDRTVARVLSFLATSRPGTCRCSECIIETELADRTLRWDRLASAKC